MVKGHIFITYILFQALHLIVKYLYLSIKKYTCILNINIYLYL